MRFCRWTIRSHFDETRILRGVIDAFALKLLFTACADSVRRGSDTVALLAQQSALCDISKQKDFRERLSPKTTRTAVDHCRSDLGTSLLLFISAHLTKQFVRGKGLTDKFILTKSCKIAILC